MSQKYDLQAAQIDHWCLKGGNDDCACDDPTDSLSRYDTPGWSDSHDENKRIASSHANANLDVVFLGDETTQAWAGKNMGRPASGGNMIAGMFNATFQKERGAVLEGLALGIGGDSVSCSLFILSMKHRSSGSKSAQSCTLGTRFTGKEMIDYDSTLVRSRESRL